MALPPTTTGPAGMHVTPILGGNVSISADGYDWITIGTIAGSVTITPKEESMKMYTAVVTEPDTDDNEKMFKCVLHISEPFYASSDSNAARIALGELAREAKNANIGNCSVWLNRFHLS